MMNLFLLLLLAFPTTLIAADTKDHGIQMRITKKGMQYVIDVGTKIMQKMLMTKSLDASGDGGGFQYRIENTRITESHFPIMKLSPKANLGVQGVFSGISLSGSGKLSYKKRIIFTIKDTLHISFSIYDIYMEFILNVGATSDGHPNIALRQCKANVGSVKLNLHSFIYNLFSGFIERKVKDMLNKMLCEMVKKEIDETAQSTLANIPVVQKLDEWTEIDYRMTSPPMFTQNYVDVFIKGEFKSLIHQTVSNLTPPSFNTEQDHDKMVYFWLTDYTINTACQAYQNSNKFDITVEGWDSKLPKAIKDVLNTKRFGLLFPALRKYQNAPMAVRLVSYKTAKVAMDEDYFHLFLHYTASFVVKEKNAKEIEVFKIRFDIDVTLMAHAQGEKIAAKITKFKYDAKVIKSNIGKIDELLDSPLVQLVIENTVISKANPYIERGFPLPHLDKVVFTNLDLKLQKNVIRLSTDISYNGGY